MIQNLHMHLSASSTFSVVAIVIVFKKWMHGAGMKLTVR